MKTLLLAFLLLPAPVFAQGIARYDLPILPTTPPTVPNGSLPPVLAVTNAIVSICSYPATMVSGMCTNTVTTYTDSTGATACPSTAQLTAPGTKVCVSTTGLQGALGFWYAGSSAHLTYTVKTTWGAFGPYDIAPSIGAAGNPASPGGAQQYANLAGNSFFADPSTLNALIYNVSNNGIALSLAECQTYSYACQVLAPAIYSQTEAPVWSPGTFAWQSRPSVATGPAYSVPPACVEDDRWADPQLNCTTWPGYKFTGVDVGPTIVVNGTHLSSAGSAGYTVGKNLWYGSHNWDGDQTNSLGFFLYEQDFAPASTNGISSWIQSNSNGDHIDFFGWDQTRGGVSAGDNEGNESRDIHIPAFDVYQGTITSVSTTPATAQVCISPCTIYAATQTQGNVGSLGSDLQATDITHADSSGYISQFINNEVIGTGVDWDATYGDSNAYGTITSAIATPGSNITVSVTTTFGTPNTTKPICVFNTASGYTYDCFPVTAASNSSLTWSQILHKYPIGSVWAQGGMTGMGFSTQADWVGPGAPYGGSNGLKGYTGFSGTPVDIQRTVFPIMYNVSGETLYMISGGRLSGNSGTAFAQMGTGGTVTATISGGAVTSCAASGGSGYSPYADVYGNMISPPQLSYSLNGGATPPVLTLTSGGGPLGGCVVQHGGSGITAITVTVTPTNPYTVYPMTHISNAWNPATGAVDGSSLAADSPMPNGTTYFQVGNTIEVPLYYASTYTQMNGQVYQYSTGGSSDGPIYSFSGYGLSYLQWMLNYNQPSLYGGYPASTYTGTVGYGQEVTPQGYAISGAVACDLCVFMPPFGNGGNVGVIRVGLFDYVNQASVASSWNFPYNVENLANINNSGNASDVETYNPATQTRAWTAGATGGNGSGAPCVMTESGTAGFSVACPNISIGPIAIGSLSNWAPYSNNFSGGTWSSTGGGGAPTLTTNQPDPWGGTSATTISGTNWALLDTDSATPLTASTGYQVCAWVNGVSGAQSFTFYAGGVVQVPNFVSATIGAWKYICGPTITTGASNLTQIVTIAAPGTTSITFAGVNVAKVGQSAGYLYTGATSQSTVTQGISPSFAQNGSAMTPSSLSINGSTPLTSVQGNGDTAALAAGTATGATGTPWCKDANGGATTVGCGSLSQSVTIAPGSGSGSGATAVCTTGATCNTHGGEVTLTLGTTPSSNAVTVTTTPALPAQFNCTVNETGPAIAVAGPTGASTTVLTIGDAAVLTSGAVTYTYVCNQ